MEISPLLVKLVGREVVKAVFETLKILDPLLISKKDPEVTEAEVS